MAADQPRAGPMRPRLFAALAAAIVAALLGGLAVIGALGGSVPDRPTAAADVARIEPPLPGCGPIPKLVDLAEPETSGGAARVPILHGYDYPRTGEAVCASLGNKNTVDCGTVTDNWVTYTLNASGLPSWTLYGARYADIAAGGGDSGSPYYRNVSGGVVALGVFSGFSGTTGFFARVHNVLPGRGWDVVK